MKTHMAKMTAQIIQLSLLTGVCFLWVGLLLPVTLQAAPNIAARYIQDNGTQIVIEITAGSNSPASVILIQKLPPGVKIISSNPRPSNYNTKKNRAKWLLRNLQPGKSTVSITLDRAVTGSEISADIRFKPQQGGKMTTKQVGK